MDERNGANSTLSRLIFCCFEHPKKFPLEDAKGKKSIGGKLELQPFDVYVTPYGELMLLKQAIIHFNGDKLMQHYFYEWESAGRECHWDSPYSPTDLRLTFLSPL